ASVGGDDLLRVLRDRRPLLMDGSLVRQAALIGRDHAALNGRGDSEVLTRERHVLGGQLVGAVERALRLDAQARNEIRRPDDAGAEAVDAAVFGPVAHHAGYPRRIRLHDDAAGVATSGDDALDVIVRPRERRSETSDDEHRHDGAKRSTTWPHK